MPEPFVHWTDLSRAILGECLRDASAAGRIPAREAAALAPDARLELLAAERR
ncbi:MAG: hypothetical protein AB7O67_08245 [Vicinamibacterales bacterium]